MSGWVPVCGRCGSMFVNHDAYEATYGYGGCATGCQNCNTGIRSDRQRRIAALEELETVARDARARLDGEQMGANEI